MTSYRLYNFIVVNLADVSRFQIGIVCQLPFTEWKVMASFVFFIVTHIPNMDMSHDVYL